MCWSGSGSGRYLADVRGTQRLLPVPVVTVDLSVEEHLQVLPQPTPFVIGEHAFTVLEVSIVKESEVAKRPSLESEELVRLEGLPLKVCLKYSGDIVSGDEVRGERLQIAGQSLPCRGPRDPRAMSNLGSEVD